MSKHEGDILKNISWFLMVVAALSVCAAIYIGISAYCLGLKYNDLGDYMGGTAGTWLSFATIIVLFVTFIFQHRQLEEQKAASEADEQARKEEGAERTFFELVALHNSIVEAMRITRPAETFLSGRECLNFIYSDLYCMVGSDYTRDEVVQLYDNVFTRHADLLGHYLRNLYHIFLFIDESPIADKQRFINIMRAQLSASEQGLLFYNGISDRGAKFRALINKYGLLEQLDTRTLGGEGRGTFYPSAAYGNAGTKGE